jgi:hypothetical protein
MTVQGLAAGYIHHLKWELSSTVEMGMENKR